MYIKSMHKTEIIATVKKDTKIDEGTIYVLERERDNLYNEWNVPQFIEQIHQEY